MKKNIIEDASIEKVAEEIFFYLQENQQAVDTIEGICQWWIMKQRINEERKRVEQALEYLLKKNLVEAHKLADGSMVYRSPKTKNTSLPSH